jgi:hypothetical protein
VHENSGVPNKAFATFAVAASPRGIASIFPIENAKLTEARAMRDPWLARRVRAGAQLVIHATSRSYPAWLHNARTALEDYAAGKTRRLPAFDLEGTPFQEKVWRKLCEIPHGKTISYATLATWVGKPRHISTQPSPSCRNTSAGRSGPDAGRSTYSSRHRPTSAPM